MSSWFSEELSISSHPCRCLLFFTTLCMRSMLRRSFCQLPTGDYFIFQLLLSGKSTIQILFIQQERAKYVFFTVVKANASNPNICEAVFHKQNHISSSSLALRIVNDPLKLLQKPVLENESSTHSAGLEPWLFSVARVSNPFCLTVPAGREG